ncbi:hypothetical protein ACFVL4_18850 [Bacillus subtilis]|uniref:Uncharacterized protein n=1 Tax=Bacillus subtilis TaxID=1423 RepID=B7U598_BACIU|nr:MULTISPECIES: hypothetical protein [Bacillus]ACJ66901.1 hypothetical protein Bsb_21 [Bacillus subtilis]APB62307.1 hypothetical protein pBS72_0380 [Bacillus subtilis]KIN40259.1 hypothetical protein B4071_4379 [Bacillus subtilis]MEC3664943.1 hypothetical protein [Bacillus subtilis]NUF07794.1 hypothetical protein [Bacillus rugosus]
MKEKGFYLGAPSGFGLLNVFKSLPDKPSSYKKNVVAEKDNTNHETLSSIDFKTILQQELNKKSVI